MLAGQAPHQRRHPGCALPSPPVALGLLGLAWAAAGSGGTTGASLLLVRPLASAPSAILGSSPALGRACSFGLLGPPPRRRHPITATRRDPTVSSAWTDGLDPGDGDGTSVSTLSVEISNSGSSASTWSPSSVSQRVIVPSVIDSPSSGMVTVVVPPSPDASALGLGLSSASGSSPCSSPSPSA